MHRSSRCIRRARQAEASYPIGPVHKVRVHFRQQWYALFDLAVEEVLYGSHSMRKFVEIGLGRKAVQDETAVCKFRYLPEQHDLARKLFDVVQKHVLGAVLDEGTAHDPDVIEEV